MNDHNKVVHNFDQTSTDEALNQDRDSVENAVEVSSQNNSESLDYTNLTEYFKNKPKKIMEHDVLNKKTLDIFHNLGRMLLDSIVILGAEGVGKTTIVENVTQKILRKKCPKNLKGTTVIEIEASLFTPNTLAEGIVYTLTGVLQDVYNSEIKKVILFFDDFHKFPPSFWESFSFVMNSLKETFDFEFFKVIVIMPTEFFTDESLYTLSFIKNSAVVSVNNLYDIILAQSILEISLEEITKLHKKIKFPAEALEFLILAVYSKCKGVSINLSIIENYIDMACSICKCRGSDCVEIQDIKQIFYDDYDADATIPETSKLNTAYHEAGHATIALAELSDIMNISGIKSVFDNSTGFAGITLSIVKSMKMKNNKKDAKRLIAFYLGGRYAEKFLDADLSINANSDLIKAMEIAKEFVYTSGSYKSLGKNCVYAYQDASVTISDEIYNLGEKECKKLIKKSKKLCKKILSEHRVFVELLAKKLQKNGFVSERELHALWKSYLKTRKNNGGLTNN